MSRRRPGRNAHPGTLQPTLPGGSHVRPFCRFHPSRRRRHADSLARGLQRLLAALRRRIEAARLAAARRRSARDLAQLEPHLLRDIGLTRNDLRRALRDDA